MKEKCDPFAPPAPGTILFSIEETLTRAKVIWRPNRFLVMARIGGDTLACHLHDPGRLSELIFQGNEILIRPTKGEKTRYSVTAAMDRGEWVLTDSRFHNAMAKKFLPAEAESEIKVGNHRLDFKVGNTYIEVKGGTLLREGKAMFPDAPTIRGTAHLRLLKELKISGNESELILLILRKDPKCFTPNYETDPDFTLAFMECLDAGVMIHIPVCRLEGQDIIYSGEIPICP